MNIFEDYQESINVIKRIPAGYLFGCFIIGVSVFIPQELHAIDCTKQTTQAEKIICSDPTLQKLDDELNGAYQEALKVSPDPDKLRESEHKWLSQRDKETLIYGVKKIQERYRSNIISLQCEKWRNLRNTPPSEINVVPTYPNIWEFLPENNENIYGKMVLFPDGDVGLQLLNHDSEQWEFKRLFFQRPITKEEQCRIWFNVGGLVDHTLQGRLSDGSIVKGTGAGEWLHGCYAGPTNSIQVYRTDPSKRGAEKLADKTFLYVLDKPQFVTDYCDVNEQEKFEYRVISLPLYLFMPLPDGTFLVMSDGTNAFEWGHPEFVMRFNNRFETEAKILNGRLFIVDTDNLNHWIETYSDFNSMQLDLYKRLMDMNKENGR